MPVPQGESRGLSPSARGRRQSPKRGAALWPLRSGHGSRGRTLRNKRNGGVRGVHSRNGRAGELQSRGTAELARSVRFRQGTGTYLRDDRLIHSRIHGDTDPGAPLSGTHVWDQDDPVGPGDPDVKPGALLSGLPPFLRSRREDHGAERLWPGRLGMGRRSRITGTHRWALRLGPAGEREGGDGTPPTGRRPLVVDGRTWVSGTDAKLESTDGRREGWANRDEGAYQGESLGSIGTDVTRQKVFSSRTGSGERSMEAGNRVIVRPDAAGCTRGPDWRELAGTLGQWRTDAVRLGVGWLAVGPGREWPAQPRASLGEDAK